jgi:hypothetical protein
MVREVARLAGIACLALTRPIEILQADRTGDVCRKRVVDIEPRRSLEHAASRVEVPVVVEMMCARLHRTARRRELRIVSGVRSRVVDP